MTDVAGVPPRQFDAAVIGAGPAGIAAAREIAAAGLRVALVDAAPKAGGQFWRTPADGPQDPFGLHHGLREFNESEARLREQARAGLLEYLPEHDVWAIEQTPDGWTVHARDATGRDPDRAIAPIRARTLLLATGAYDRQLPFPGWTLPGVVTAGGAQALLKGHSLAAARTAVVAGTGPFLLPVATGLARAGTRVAAVVEANSPAGFTRRPDVLLRSLSKLAEAASYARQLAAHRISYRRRTVVLEAQGDDHLEAVVIAKIKPNGDVVRGSRRRLECDLLAVGWGFTPRLELHLQAGCETTVDTDGSLIVAVDDEQRTSAAGVWAAGESTGVGGAELATVEGTIAGIAVAASLGAGRADTNPGLRRLRRRRARLRAFARLMHRTHPVAAGYFARLPDHTVVCRCEEVQAGTVRAAVRDLSAADARTAKLMTRAGMGRCQARVCGFATACLVADAAGHDVDRAELLALSARPLAGPVPLGVLAAEPVDSALPGPGQSRP